MEIIKQGFLNLHGRKVFAVFCMRNEPLLESKCEREKERKKSLNEMK